MLTNLRMDPFERANDESIQLHRLGRTRMFMLAPAGGYVATVVAELPRIPAAHEARQFQPRPRDGGGDRTAQRQQLTEFYMSRPMKPINQRKIKMNTTNTNIRIIQTITRSALLLGAVFGAGLALNAPAQETKSAAPLSAERSLLVTVTAKVEAVDQAKREVTLKGPLGNVVTFVVDQRVKRLQEVKVGDEVTADYYVSLAGELRPPTEEEKNNPLTILEGGAHAPKGTSQAGGVLPHSRSWPRSSAWIFPRNRLRCKVRSEIPAPFAPSTLRNSSSSASVTPSSSLSRSPRGLSAKVALLDAQRNERGFLMTND